MRSMYALVLTVFTVTAGAQVDLGNALNDLSDPDVPLSLRLDAKQAIVTDGGLAQLRTLFESLSQPVPNPLFDVMPTETWPVPRPAGFTEPDRFIEPSMGLISGLFALDGPAQTARIRLDTFTQLADRLDDTPGFTELLSQLADEADQELEQVAVVKAMKQSRSPEYVAHLVSVVRGEEWALPARQEAVLALTGYDPWKWPSEPRNQLVDALFEVRGSELALWGARLVPSSRFSSPKHVMLLMDVFEHEMSREPDHRNSGTIISCALKLKSIGVGPPISDLDLSRTSEAPLPVIIEAIQTWKASTYQRYEQATIGD